MANPYGWTMKTLPFTQKGAGLAYSGYTPDNILSAYPTIYAQRGQKQGGMAQLWDSLNTYARERSGNDPGLAEYLKTGNSANLKSDVAANAYDYAIREAARSQQHKQPSFLEGLFTNILPELVLNTVGNMVVPGLGTALSTVYGGVKGGVDSGSFLGGITGALSGYGAGKFGSGLADAGSAAGGWNTFANSPLQWGENLAGNAWKGVTDTVSNLGTSAKNALTDVKNWTFGAPPNANAVPGLSTGVTTPAGGGAIVGSGQAAPLLGVGGVPTGGAVNLADFLGSGITGQSGLDTMGAATKGLAATGAGGISNVLSKIGSLNFGTPATFNAVTPTTFNMPTDSGGYSGYSGGSTLSSGDFGGTGMYPAALAGSANGMGSNSPSGADINVLSRLQAMGLYS